MYEFEIRGNHNNPRGNPVPYTRTLSHAWRNDATRYKQWLRHVLNSFLSNYSKGKEVRNIYTHGKPLVLGPDEMAQMDITIFWKNKRHGDPDNIFKGIADALFYDDREVYGSIKLGGFSDKPRVKVNIKICKLKQKK